MLGFRSMVYDEATKIAGKNNNFHRVDLWNSIEAGWYPEWEFMIQMFPDDGQGNRSFRCYSGTTFNWPL